MKSERRSQKGFSLIELIIAIAILVILTGLLAPQFMKYIERSREAKDLQTLDTIYEGVQAALTNEKAYKAVEAEIKNYEYGKSVNDMLTDADANDFSRELKNILGASSFKLTSQKAVAGGELFISVSDKMEVGVFYGTRKVSGAIPMGVPGLCIGVLSVFVDPAGPFH